MKIFNLFKKTAPTLKEMPAHCEETVSKEETEEKESEKDIRQKTMTDVDFKPLYEHLYAHNEAKISPYKKAYEYTVSHPVPTSVKALSSRYIMIGSISFDKDFFYKNLYPALCRARAYLYQFEYDTIRDNAYSELKSRIARMISAASRRTYLLHDYEANCVLCALTFVLIVHSLGDLALSYKIYSQSGQRYDPFVMPLNAFIRKTKTTLLKVIKKDARATLDRGYSTGLMLAGKDLAPLLNALSDDDLIVRVLCLKRKDVLYQLLLAVLTDKDGEDYYLEPVRPNVKTEFGVERVADKFWFESADTLKAGVSFDENIILKNSISQYRNFSDYVSVVYERKLQESYKQLIKLNEKLLESREKARCDYQALQKGRQALRASFEQNIKQTQIKNLAPENKLTADIKKAEFEPDCKVKEESAFTQAGAFKMTASLNNEELQAMIKEYLSGDGLNSIEQVFDASSRAGAFLFACSKYKFNNRLSEVIRQRLNSILSFIRDGALSCDFDLEKALDAAVSDYDYARIMCTALYSFSKDKIRNKFAVSTIEKFIKDKTRAIKDLTQGS